MKPLFEIVTTTLGVKSIRNTVVNEIMHNPVGPWVEANKLYVEQSHLRERLEEGRGELVIFDVGLGAAANALAVLHCARESGERRPIRMVSFEKDLNLLRFALANAKEFEHFRGYETAIEKILADHVWSEPGLRWELREGEFPEKILEEKAKPHLIYFDPYSPEVNREMWGLENFGNLRRICREPAEDGTILFTYSRATPIRAALLAAGFFVGLGDATGLKDETTQASTDISLLKKPLDKLWLDRWGRSHTPYPLDLSEPEQNGFRGQILGHPQFAR